MNIAEFTKPVTAKTLNESLAKRFGKRINLESFTLEQLQDARNKLRTKMSQVEMTENFSSVVESDAYNKSKAMLDVLNAEISERGDIEEEAIEEAKPDYIDIDGDGDKEEPMKKAAKDAKKKKKVSEEGSLKEDARELMAFLKDQGITDVDPKLQLAIRDYFYDKKKTAPQSSSGEQEWDWKGALEAEAEILMKAGHSREQAYKQAYRDIKHRRTFEPGGKMHNAMNRHDQKVNDLLARRARGEIPRVSPERMDQIRAQRDAMFRRTAGDEFESMEEQVQNSIVNALMEGAEDQAEIVMAAKDMVDRVTNWMEDTAEMQTESMLELADAIRDEMGSEKSEAFVAGVKPSLEAMYAAMESTRGALSGGVGLLTGEGDMPAPMGAPDDMGGEMEPTVDMEADPALDMPIDAGAPAAGGEVAAGREQRESIDPRRLAKTLSKKK